MYIFLRSYFNACHMNFVRLPRWIFLVKILTIKKHTEMIFLTLGFLWFLVIWGSDWKCVIAILHINSYNLMLHQVCSYFVYITLHNCIDGKCIAFTAYKKT